MRLHPHIHLLVPSSDAKVLLEARLYVPANSESDTPLSSIISTSDTNRTSSILRHDELGQVLDDLKRFKISRLVTAAHPFSRMGGNQLDPVLTHHLLESVYSQVLQAKSPVPTAVITYNVRGNGLSQGSSPYLTPGNDPADFAAVERWAVGILCSSEQIVEDVRRFGYSYGCISATLAPLPDPSTASYSVKALMLVSPPLKILSTVTYFAGSIDDTIRQLMSPSSYPKAISGQDKKVEVWTICGDSDVFAGTSNFEKWIRGLSGIIAKDVEGDHFWRSEMAGRELREYIGRWLSEAGE